MFSKKSYSTKSNANRAAKAYGPDVKVLPVTDSAGMPTGAFHFEIPLVVPAEEAFEGEHQSQEASEADAKAAPPEKKPAAPSVKAEARKAAALEREMLKAAAKSAAADKRADRAAKKAVKHTERTERKTARAAKKAAKAAAPKKTRTVGTVGASVEKELLARWTPVGVILKMTKWLPHTFRSWISTWSRAHNYTVERKRDENKVTWYRFLKAA